MNKKLYRLYQWVFKGVPVVKVTPQISPLLDEKRLEGKNVVVIGGTRGIGFSIAKKCQECGAHVLIAGRHEDDLIAASKKLNECLWLQYDLQSIGEAPAFLRKADELLGRVDCLVNNAALYLHEPDIMSVTSDGFDAQFNTNVKGPYFLSQAFIQYVREHGMTGASLLFISSEFGLYCSDLPYSLGKAAIVNFTEGLARRVAKEGIRVNAIAPGVMTNDIPGTDYEDIYRKHASGNRFIMPEEIGEIASYLLSDAANCITGYVIPCNQGNHLRCDW